MTTAAQDVRQMDTAGHAGVHSSVPSTLPSSLPSTVPSSVRRIVLMGLAALGLASLHLAHRPATLCPLRMLTGVPCPFCGGTTAAVAVGRLDIPGALRANPLVLGGAVWFGASPLTPSRVVAWWRSLPAGVRLGVVGAVLVASETWQLARFGWLS